ncbi:MAG: hypothetical protein WC861_01505 [Candidatus Micrarchaeia archaeon]|jgi:hypothetical protein
MKSENKKGATSGKKPGQEKQDAHLKADEKTSPEGKAGIGQPGTPSASGKGIIPSIRLTERDRKAGFALLVVAAIALAAYVALFMPPSDKPSDIDTFVGRVIGASNVSLLMDARGASQESARIVFQCGVDIAGGRLFGSKTVISYACDNGGCISVNSASNGSNTLTYDTVQRQLRGTPYVLVRAGAPSTAFFENHAEITLDESFNASCKLG